jgi:hypothetical protein
MNVSSIVETLNVESILWKFNGVLKKNTVKDSQVSNFMELCPHLHLCFLCNRLASFLTNKCFCFFKMMSVREYC